MEYIKREWGDTMKGMSTEYLVDEGTTMLKHRIIYTKLAIDDLLDYTNMLATILGVIKEKTIGETQPHFH